MVVPAAVSVVFRRSGEDLEVLLVKRAEHLQFLGGFWALPGGRVEPSDRDVVAAAARELAEETGLDIPADEEHFQFAGRTVTPPWAPLRFDTTYFLVEAPPGARADLARAGGEIVALAWVTPRLALAEWCRGERIVSPVVRGALRSLLPGLHRAPERMAKAIEEEANLRLWDLVPGLSIAMLRTPTLPPAAHTNCYVVGAREMVVIDPGSPYPDEQEALDLALDVLRSQGRTVREIWLTHHHADHLLGAKHLSERLGLAIAAHESTARLVAGDFRAVRLIHDGETTIFAGDPNLPERRLRAIHTPGHAPGHLCFFEETTGFLIAGDMVAGVGTIVIDPAEGDMAAYLRSLARLRDLRPRALLPAHGPPIFNAVAKLDEYTQHRLWRETRVLEALRKCGDATPSELVGIVYCDVDNTLFPLAERSLLAHLLKLEKEGRVYQSVPGRFALT